MSGLAPFELKLFSVGPAGVVFELPNGVARVVISREQWRELGRPETLIVMLASNEPPPPL